METAKGDTAVRAHSVEITSLPAAQRPAVRCVPRIRFVDCGVVNKGRVGFQAGGGPKVPFPWVERVVDGVAAIFEAAQVAACCSA